jgi:hypothetical protein
MSSPSFVIRMASLGSDVSAGFVTSGVLVDSRGSAVFAASVVFVSSMMARLSPTLSLRIISLCVASGELFFCPKACK